VVGIAKVALENVGHNFITININNKDYRLFHSRELTVFDALGLIEYNLGDLIGKNGKDLRFMLNGERKVIFGGLCKPAEVYINGEPATLKAALNEGNRIIIEKTVRGEDARAYLRDFVEDYPPLTLSIDGKDEFFEAQCFINGRKVSLDQEITDGDRVEIRTINNALSLAESRGTDLYSHDIFVNGQKVSGDKRLNSGDRVEFCKNNKSFPDMPFSGTSARIPGNRIQVNVNKRNIVLDDKAAYIFVDIFNHIDLTGAVSGGKIKLLLNGQEAKYTDPINEGDVIEVGWY